MKSIIAKEILKTKMQEPHNTKYIMRLQQLMDADEVTIKDFVDTGVLHKRNDFESMYGTIELHNKCTDVMLYMGGHYIQFLSDGKYLVQYDTKSRGKRSADINKMEEYLFKMINNVG